MVDTRSVDENENEHENDDENENADAKGASVAFGPYGRRTLFATAARSISAACDKGEVYLPQRSVL